MNVRYLWVLTFVGTCSLAPCGHAAELLRLDDAVRKALQSNPAIAAETARLESVRNRAAREGMPTQYTVGGEFENAVGTGSLSGINAAETTLRVGRLFELGGKRAARQTLGTAESQLQRSAVDVARLDVMQLTASRYIRVLADEHEVEHTAERVQQAERTRAEVARWVRAARNPDSDLRTAELALAEGELAHAQAKQALIASKAALVASWGGSDLDVTVSEDGLAELPEVEGFETLAARLPATPDQQMAQQSARAISARRAVAVASGRPDLSVTLGVRRLEALDDQGLVMSVSMPLGSRKRAAYSIAEADADLAALDGTRESNRLVQRQLLFETYQQLQQVRLEVEAIRTVMLPKAGDAVSITRRGFDAGRFSFLLLAQAERAQFDLRAREIEASARYHTLFVDIERLTAPLSDSFL
ncbi:MULTISPECIES: TolC family protein [Xanthomonas]|uniref:TolC family protein n=1 Tax=Xanthomonas TaxID=338 RepID=UPI000E1F777D|nr:MULTISPECIES: TolC family protein [Xanthomonas]